VTLPVLANPYDDQAIEDVHLDAAPLALVLAQVRYPPLVALEVDDGGSAYGVLARDLRSSYPVIAEAYETVLQITADGVSQTQGARKIMQLVSADDAWKVTVGHGFVSLQTTSYGSRAIFVERFEEIISSFAHRFSPTRVDRIGLRYFNRIENPTPSMLRRLIRPDVLGAAAEDLPFDVDMRHCMTQALYNSGAMSMQVQSALLPPTAVLDQAMAGVDVQSWVLDIDSFSLAKTPFDTNIVVDSLRGLADQAYRCFRWAVTPDFLTEFGR
jgi:uncharacterized protein (TIGR04255 family)